MSTTTEGLPDDPAGTPSDPVLEVRDLRVSFGRSRRVAVEDVDLRIGRGARVGLIGESGSGKSVTALAVMGLLPENAHVDGDIRLAGHAVIGRPDRYLRRLRGDQVSMVFQEPMTALDPTMKAGRQVAEVVRLHHGTDAQGRVLAELAATGLAEPERIADSYPHQLSGGQRQRVLIAMALINRPGLVICDEPTTALDVTVQRRVLATLDERLDSSGAACLFISHDLAVVSAMCEELVVLRHGRVVERGATADLLVAARHPYTRALVAAARLEDFAPGSRLPVIGEEGP